MANPKKTRAFDDPIPKRPITEGAQASIRAVQAQEELRQNRVLLEQQAERNKLARQEADRKMYFDLANAKPEAFGSLLHTGGAAMAEQMGIPKDVAAGFFAEINRSMQTTGAAPVTGDQLKQVFDQYPLESPIAETPVDDVGAPRATTPTTPRPVQPTGEPRLWSKSSSERILEDATVAQTDAVRMQTGAVEDERGRATRGEAVKLQGLESALVDVAGNPLQPGDYNVARNALFSTGQLPAKFRFAPESEQQYNTLVSQLTPITGSEAEARKVIGAGLKSGLELTEAQGENFRASAAGSRAGARKENALAKLMEEGKYIPGEGDPSDPTGTGAPTALSNARGARIKEYLDANAAADAVAGVVGDKPRTLKFGAYGSIPIDDSIGAMLAHGADDSPAIARDLLVLAQKAGIELPPDFNAADIVRTSPASSSGGTALPGKPLRGNDLLSSIGKERKQRAGGDLAFREAVLLDPNLGREPTYRATVDRLIRNGLLPAEVLNASASGTGSSTGATGTGGAPPPADDPNAPPATRLSSAVNQMAEQLKAESADLERQMQRLEALAKGASAP